MKQLTNSIFKFLFLVGCCSSLWAYPEMGDFVRFEALYEGQVVTLEKKILSHDVEKNSYLVRNLMLYNNEIIQDQTFELPHSFLYNPTKVQNVLETCESREGALGDMMVEDKNVKVCEFYDENSQLTYMIGHVPFGQVRFQIYLKDEEFLDFHLKRFHLGK